MSSHFVEIPEIFASVWVCFSGRSRQTIETILNLCFPYSYMEYLTLVLIRTKSFQIGLNHSCCLWQLLHIVLYHNIRIYCISGLNDVKQVNAHCCFVLAYPNFLKFETFQCVASKCTGLFCTCIISLCAIFIEFEVFCCIAGNCICSFCTCQYCFHTFI